MPANKVKIKLLPVLIISLILAGHSEAQSQYPADAKPSTRSRQSSASQRDVYQESALRRFEIVTLVSLPFTAIHSFLAVRGVEMIRQKQVAPELDSADFKIMGISAMSFALFIGFWDWLHTHDENLSEQLIPTSPPTAPPAKKVSAPEWELEDSQGLFVPLVLIQF
jgi:hypothetical protein